MVSWVPWSVIYPEDVNRQQAFGLPVASEDGFVGLKLTFDESSDFFGRITVYDLAVEGTESTCTL